VKAFLVSENPEKWKFDLGLGGTSGIDSSPISWHKLHLKTHHFFSARQTGLPLSIWRCSFPLAFFPTFDLFRIQRAAVTGVPVLLFLHNSPSFIGGSQN
jgi:hypothetical protein